MLRLDGQTGPDNGTYAVSMDDDAMPSYEGYATGVAILHGRERAMPLAAGKHTLEFRCEGKGDASGGYDTVFDALVGAAL